MTDHRTADGDDALIAELRADLDAFAGAAGPAPDVPFAVRTARAPRRPRPWIMVGAAAATVAVLVTGLVLIANRDVDPPEQADGPATTPAITPATAPVDSSTPNATGPAVAPMPVPPTPDGWVVVEWGDVRMSLPPEIDPYDGRCAATSDRDLVLTIACDGRVIEVLSGIVGGTPVDDTTIRNGLTTELGPVTDDPARTGLSIVETMSAVRFAGFTDAEVESIVATVGVSSRWRVANEPAPAVPDGWRHVGFDNIDLMIPDDWPSVSLTAGDVDPDACGFHTLGGVATFERGGATTADGGASVSCAGQPPVIAPPSDGIRIYELEPGEKATNPPGYPYVEQSYDIAGEGRRYLLRVGLGGDGTIGRTILGSVTVTPIDGGPTGPESTAPATLPPSTTTPPIGEVYETMGTVIDTPASGPMLCFGVLDSYPPQCGTGIPLTGWSWELIDGETRQGDTTWFDGAQVYVVGAYDVGAGAMNVLEARLGTEDDVARLIVAAGFRGNDFSTPCPAPAGGWQDAPFDPTSWPADAIARLDGYGGAWVDEREHVYTVLSTGDLAEAELAVRALYDGPVCIAQARRTFAELEEIQTQLMSLSSVQVLSSAVMIDATGGWVDATLIAPHPQLQASLDAQYGAGTVELHAMLVPLP